MYLIHVVLTQIKTPFKLLYKKLKMNTDCFRGRKQYLHKSKITGDRI
jgi:hypothetical protein